MNCWISVEDRLPEEGEEVLVVFRWNGTRELYVSYDKWQYGSWRDILNPFDVPWFQKKVLYWMPLPEPPKEEEDDRQGESDKGT